MASNDRDGDDEGESLWSPHDKAAPQHSAGQQPQQQAKASLKRTATQAVALLLQQKLADDSQAKLAFKHAESCTSDSCQFPNCKGLKHFGSCESAKCSFCVLARLVALQTKLSDETWRQLMETTKSHSEELVRCSELKKSAQAKDLAAADEAYASASAAYNRACASVGEHYLFLFGKARVVPNSTKSSSNAPAATKPQASSSSSSAAIAASAPTTFYQHDTRSSLPLQQGSQQQQNSSSSNLSRHHRSTSLPIFTGPPPTGSYSAPIMLVQVPLPAAGGWIPQMAGPTMVAPPFALNLNPQAQQFPQAYQPQPIFIQQQPLQQHLQPQQQQSQQPQLPQQQPPQQQQHQSAKRVSPPTEADQTERFEKLVKVAGDANPIAMPSATPSQPDSSISGPSS